MAVMLALQVLFNAALLATVAYALSVGDGPEIAGGLTNLIACLLTWASQLARAVHWEAFDGLVFAIDVTVAVAFFELAARSKRFWPIWCFAFALDDLFVQVARIVTPKIDTVAYASISATIWAYLALAALAVGTTRALQQRRKTGVDAEWAALSCQQTIMSSSWFRFRARASRGWRTR